MIAAGWATEGSRTVEIMADAAYEILTRPSQECSGNFFIDEVLLRDAGVTDFDQYAVAPGQELFRDFFVPDEVIESLPTKTITMY